MNTSILNIYGKVQGVFFRANAKREADKYSLFGYAKNLSDGSVRCLIQGEPGNIAKFIEWAQKGTSPARVERVEVMESKNSQKFNEFSVL